jgi:hypothetical protein
MVNFKKSLLILNTIFAFMSSTLGQSSGLVLFDSDKIAAVKQSYLRGSKEYFPQIRKLKQDADKALKFGPFSVLDKNQIPPSGDKHDYMSMGPYWWPDTMRPDGKPYIRRDGETNPETKAVGDPNNINMMIKSVVTLSLAYYYLNNESYAEYAIKLLRVWFINPETKMNPNLNYAQAIPGRTDGRGGGSIDARMLPELLDGINLISSSAAWTNNDRVLIHKWFEEYLEWLLESKNGRQEANNKNNHGTWYDVQATAIAIFVGRNDVAEKIIKESMAKRIAHQIEPDGRQPEELKRTMDLHYSLFNIEALFRLAKIAEYFKVDLWNYKTEDGRCIQNALDFLLHYANGEIKWKYEQIKEYEYEKSYPLLYIAAIIYKDEKYKKAYEKIAGIDPIKQRVLILY